MDVFVRLHVVAASYRLFHRSTTYCLLNTTRLATLLHRLLIQDYSDDCRAVKEVPAEALVRHAFLGIGPALCFIQLCSGKRDAVMTGTHLPARPGRPCLDNP